MPKLAKQIGKRLESARKAAGFTSARKFSCTHKIPESTYLQHEIGARCPNAEMLHIYCKALELLPTWLLTGKGYPYETNKNSHIPTINKKINSLAALNVIDSDNIPTINIQNKIFHIDMDLFSKILKEAVSVYREINLDIDGSNFFDFCTEVYNSIIVTNTDDASKDTMIRLSVDSLKRGAIKKSNTYTKTGNIS